jgi:FMN phosphatase YigB (HAD superfamily)
LEMGAIPLDSTFFVGFGSDLSDAERWRTFYYGQQATGLVPPGEVPPVPEIDAEHLFNAMMAASVGPDPWMFPALLKLKAANRFILAALSNTVVFPLGHPLYTRDFFADDPVRRVFDVFVSSAHEGIRKPDPRVYSLALDRVNSFVKDHADDERLRLLLGGESGIAAADVLFLDDIGENLREAKKFGFATIKVPLGRTYETVEELERVTGLSLGGSHPKVPSGATRETKGKI